MARGGGGGWSAATMLTRRPCRVVSRRLADGSFIDSATTRAFDLGQCVKCRWRLSYCCFLRHTPS